MEFDLDNKSIGFVAVGDIFLDRNDAGESLSYLSDFFNGYELAFCNLEAPISNEGKPFLGKRIRLISPISSIGGLGAMNMKLVSFSNNHALDYGVEAFLNTLEALDSNNIDYVGAGEDAGRAWEPILYDVQGCRLGIIAFTTVAPAHYKAGRTTPGISYLPVHTSYQPQADLLIEQPGSPPITHTWILPDDLETLSDKLEETRSKVDYVIVSVHWGIAFSTSLSDYQQFLGRWLVRRGVDVVIGHHPHTVQGVETYKGKYIFYSLGNFIFDYQDSRASKRGLVLDCSFGPPPNKYIKIRLIATLLGSEGNPRLFNEETSMFEQLRELSEPLGTTMIKGAGDIILLEEHE